MSCEHLIEANYIKSIEKQLIYKDQCTKCFSDPTVETLSLCLKCLNGGCQSKHAGQHFTQTKHPLVLNIKKEIDNTKMEEEQEEITKLAIGKPGGAQLDNSKKYITHTQLFCLACNKELDSTSLEGLIKSIVESKSSFYQQQLSSWEVETIPCEHCLLLEQFPPFKLSDKCMNKCTECELTKNLWLCLTCGNIGCGRKYFDGTGGNKHALAHKRDTQHPLVVKLGTITPEGTGSCYCYRCDNEVRNDNLATHLSNFGINVINQIKTEQTVEEMNLEANLNLSLSKAIEEGQELELLFGKGYTGLQNIGSTCYMNSVMQALFSIKEFNDNYYNLGQIHLNNCTRFAPNCFTCQMAKLGHGLESGVYSEKQEIIKKTIEDKKVKEETEYGQNGLNLQDLKTLIGKSHPQFASLSQQDAEEFLQSVLSCLEKEEKFSNFKPTNKLFEFDQIQMLQCTKCHAFKTTEAKGLRMKVNPPYKKVEKDDKEYDVDMKTLLQANPMEATYRCAFCNSMQFSITEYMVNFPQYLIISVNRFEIDNFMPTKIQAYLQSVEDIDVQNWKYSEPPAEWKHLPEDIDEQAAPEVNEAHLAYIMGMGYSKNRAYRALQQNNNNLEVALNFIFETLDDATQEEPIEQKGSNISEALIAQVTMMGFSEEQAKIALKKNNNNVAQAIDYIFDNPEEIQQNLELKKSISEPSNNFTTQYSLQSAIIHLGTSIKCGHYISYAKKNNDWIYYNDEKVAKSKNPLLGKASLLIYKRK